MHDPSLHWIQALEEQKEVLARLLATTSAIRDSLKVGEDVSELLESRDMDCKALKRAFERVDSLQFEIARGDGSELPKDIAERTNRLECEIKQLGQQIALVQSECENIMKTRLQLLANALKESAQRRLMESTYGPACSATDTPVFIDKHQ